MAYLRIWLTMENREYLNSLFDIYKELLTKTEQETFINYYVEDLSLSEIAYNRNISKSSVGKTLKQAVEKLASFENLLKMKFIKNELNKALEINNITDLKNEIIKIISN